MSIKSYKGYCCFENYWQSGKRYDGIDENKCNEWWLNQKSGKRRYPNSKNKKVLYCIFEDGIKRDYINSRKNIYVPFYHELVKDTQSIHMCKNLLMSGNDIVIYDFDGPRKEDGDNNCVLLTKNILIEKINDPIFSFGHGYIIGAELLDINYHEYIG
jgi:hypothetical protein